MSYEYKYLRSFIFAVVVTLSLFFSTLKEIEQKKHYQL